MATDRTIPLGPVSLRVTEAGRGGRPLLLSHGFGGSRGDFVEFLDPLAERGWHAVAPDLRGHGESDKPEDEADYSFDTFADDLLQLATELGWPQFVLLGHSMGGMIAQHVVRLAPERVNALVLLDTTHETVEMDADIVALGLQVARNEGLAQLVELSRQYDDPLETPAHRRLCAEVPGYRERGDNATIRSSPSMYAALGVEITSPHDRLAGLASVSCPTLVIVGEQDTPMIAPSERMAATIPGATLAVVAGGGHSPQFEATDGLLAALLPFLDRVAAGALVAEA